MWIYILFHQRINTYSHLKCHSCLPEQISNKCLTRVTWSWLGTGDKMRRSSICFVRSQSCSVNLIFSVKRSAESRQLSVLTINLCPCAVFCALVWLLSFTHSQFPLPILHTAIRTENLRLKKWFFCSLDILCYITVVYY